MALRRGNNAPVTVAAAPELTDHQKHNLVDQSQRPKGAKLYISLLALGTALLLSFIDQTSVSTATPKIGEQLNASGSISWVGTSFLVANTISCVPYGRLSDIFGRKVTLLTAMTILSFGDLLCGFAKTPIQLYIFRAIAGLGFGGINSCVMIIMSDLVSLKERGKYQGALGAFIALGNSIGPFIGAALVDIKFSWVFWITPMLALPTGAVVWFIIPQKPTTGNFAEKLKKIDYLGIIVSLAAILLILVPVSGGGTEWAWDSATVISLFVVGITLAIAFIYIEGWVAPLPILPLRLFKSVGATSVLLQTFLSGMVYYGNSFYLPIYYISIRGFTTIEAAALMLPLLLTQTISSVGTGQIVFRTGKVKPSILVGFLFWTVAAGLEYTFGLGSSKAYIIGLLVIQGLSVGSTLQTTLVSAQAAVAVEDRAVITSTRNLFRNLGGSFALAIFNSVFHNSINSKISTVSISSSLKAQIVSANLVLPSTLNSSIAHQIHNIYETSIKKCFLIFIPVIGVAFLLSFSITEIPLRADPKEVIPMKDPAAQDIEMQVAEVVENVESQTTTVVNRNEDEINVELELLQKQM